jgi:hypothetical protein
MGKTTGTTLAAGLLAALAGAGWYAATAGSDRGPAAPAAKLDADAIGVLELSFGK